ncbi:MAG: TM2 domain-containing protein [Coprobacillus sp.]|nr:TM2 domain-containing protein [Coprobacillus sp.]
MPYCKYCNARISKFDTDRCPVCGHEKPLEGVTSETIDITSQIDINESAKVHGYHSHKRMICFIYSCFLGIFGAPLFYLKYITYGLCWLVVNLAILLGAGVTLWISFSWIYFLIVLIVLYIFNILFGLFYLFKSDLKDKDGEFVH